MILIDTCVLFWLECDPGKLSSTAKYALGAPNTRIHASAISAFELGLKVRNQQLKLPIPISAWISEICIRRGIRLLPIDAVIAGRSTELPLIHKDPCDRFLIATALTFDLRMITPDASIKKYPDLKVIW